MNRIGQFWTANEEGLLLLRVAEGKTLDQIALELGRTERSVEWRRNAIIARLFQQGRSCAYLSNLFQVSIDVVEDALRPSLIPSLQTACNNLRNS